MLPLLPLALFLAGCQPTPRAQEPGPATTTAQPKQPVMFEYLGKRRASSRPTLVHANTAPGSSDELDPARRGPKGWTIALMKLTGPGAEVAAQQALTTIASQTGLAGTGILAEQGSYTVICGDYPSQTDPRAQDDLARIRALRVDAATPFEGAMLMPPGLAQASREGSMPDFDLSTLRSRRGNDAAYTLQIAMYTALDNAPPTDKELDEFRAAAERAVSELRAQGEEAFYYHGPRGSTVTLGVFGEDDYRMSLRTDALGGVRSAGTQTSTQLRALQERHPHTLVNGQGLRFRRSADNAGPQGKGVMQPSLLVKIP